MARITRRLMLTLFNFPPFLYLSWLAANLCVCNGQLSSEISCDTYIYLPIYVTMYPLLKFRQHNFFLKSVVWGQHLNLFEGINLVIIALLLVLLLAQTACLDWKLIFSQWHFGLATRLRQFIAQAQDSQRRTQNGGYMWPKPVSEPLAAGFCCLRPPEATHRDIFFFFGEWNWKLAFVLWIKHVTRLVCRVSSLCTFVRQHQFCLSSGRNMLLVSQVIP
jgi:hypothetical protein